MRLYTVGVIIRPGQQSGKPATRGGPDGRTKYLSKETRAGHVGLDKHGPASLLGKQPDIVTGNWDCIHLLSYCYVTLTRSVLPKA